MSDKKQKRRLFAALGSKAYDRALAIANAVVCAPMRLLNLIKKGQEKVLSRLQKAGSAVLADTNASLRLLQAYAEGSYREVSTDNVVLLIASVAYFVAPIDAIPDFFLGLGLTDDLALLTWTFSKLREELEHFKSWEMRKNSIDPDPIALPNSTTNSTTKGN